MKKFSNLVYVKYIFVIVANLHTKSVLELEFSAGAQNSDKMTSKSTNVC